MSQTLTEIAAANPAAPAEKLAGLLAQQLIQSGVPADEARREATEAVMTHSRQRAQKRQRGEEVVYQFFSSSKASDDLNIGMPGWRRLLSNFARVESLQVFGVSYPTVEHCFQSAKYTLVAAEDKASRFETGGSLGNDPAKAKSAGGRRGFEAAGCKLDLAAWDGLADAVMWSALVARSRCDGDFARVLVEATAQGVTLLHFERSGARSYWGGSLSKADGRPQGRNRLGEMLMALGEWLAAEGQQHAAPQPAERRSPSERRARWGAIADAMRAGKPWCELAHLAL